MMTQSNRTEHDAKIQELKERFERDGYAVLIEPRGLDLPFDLGNYVPDLVARKPDGGLIVEVKTANARTSIERYQSLAHTVQQHAGWRFVLVTVDDLNVPASLQETVSWGELEAKLGTIRLLIDNGNAEPAILYLWSVFEAAMRKLAITVAMPIERLPATKLMNQLYTVGYIAIDDFKTAKKFLTMRNGITHGFGTPPDVPVLESFLRAVTGLIREWKNECADKKTLDD
ncbi:hypothetical protein WI93_16780 [Burkholderia vietnamiensis]|uniref:hypothetical protein n=1 Tax=Burkholderia vietnamiensis TaxID=60552 RepID=UPI00075526B8|nr:hypothetical protein [Burkholderia vietnamiensis]KVE25169.1 hypothetical protein WI93_16780 [Burkholderia vietnamiensis]